MPNRKSTISYSTIDIFRAGLNYESRISSKKLIF